jgi:hypothetical protein
MSEERRKEMTKLVRHEGESAKIAVRNLRRDANEQREEAGQGQAASEDDQKRAEADIQKVTDRHISEIDSLVAGQGTGDHGCLTAAIAHSMSSIPHHIAIVMDGNGRWATRRFLPRVAGHKKGVDALRACVSHCGERGVKVLTVFAFSSENWNRPPKKCRA